MVAELGDALQTADETAIRRCSHSLKGTLNHLGAWQCAEIAWSIEENCDSQPEEIQTKYIKLKETLADLTLELKRFKNGQQEIS